jgi:hypothetical protein
VTTDLSGASFIKGDENEIKVFTSNYLKEIGKGNIQSRGFVDLIRDKRQREFRLPSLYAIVGGISDYTGYFSHALSLGAKRLYCDKQKPDCLDKVQITTLSTSGNKGTIQPTKENFKKIFAEIAQKAGPEDIVIIYLAGHVVTLGSDSYFI